MSPAASTRSADGEMSGFASWSLNRSARTSCVAAEPTEPWSTRLRRVFEPATGL